YIEENNSPRFREEIKKLRDKGQWDFPFDIFISMLLNRKGHHMINSIRQVGIDGTDAVSLTKGMIEGRDEGKRLFDIVKASFPGYENAKISSTAETLGVRETKRIVGKYMLTFNDLVEGKDFNDIIALSSYCFDVPDPKKPSYQPKEGVKTKKKYAEVPYSCMLPDKVANLIVAGRSISVERIVMGPLRVMGPCIGMGQAAGFAASIAVENDISYANVDIKELKRMLIEADCIIKEDDVCIVRNDI
ncbi:MAG: FAD-dependent oxidoreductase, partial [Clostridia bacterium]|nr:FAD-dependent oxidoreductase [Clostridia bacterium]